MCLNVKEPLAWNRDNIWSLSDRNKIWTHNHLFRKWTLNHLAKIGKWLSCVVSTYLYSAFYCMLLSCHVSVSEWIYTLYLPECQLTTCSKKVQNLKWLWVRIPLLSLTNTVHIYLQKKSLWMTDSLNSTLYSYLHLESIFKLTEKINILD